MFLRKHTVCYRDKTYTSYRLCRTVRDKGRVRQEIVANLGKLSDREAERIGRQLLTIAGKIPPQPGESQQGPAFLYGGPLLVQALMELAELEALLAPLGQTRRRLDLYRTLSVALWAQLLTPGSDLQTSQWQSKLLVTRHPYAIPYEHFLRMLDVLSDHHAEIEEGLFGRVKHLFNQRVDVALYDLTSSYFEGRGPGELARRGYSRDGRGDCPQIVLGLAVTKDGFPIAYGVHPGNTVDVQTVQQVVLELGQRFEVDRLLVVGDSGLLSRENAEKLTELGVGYILGMRAASTQAAQDAIAATAEIEPAGRLGEVSYWPVVEGQGKAYIVLHSAGREHKTQAIVQRKLAQVRPRLGQLERDVRLGKVRSPATIAARATRILVEAKATPYIELQIGPGRFSWQEKRAKLQALARDAGKYVLETNQLGLSPQEAAVAYRQLEVVEDSFRRLKHTLGLRPIYHRWPQRVVGHIGLCVMALFLLRVLEDRLLSAGICLTAEQALEAAQELQAVPITLGDRKVWPLPYVSATAAAIFRAVGITDAKARFKADLEALGLDRPA